jgi:Holliday junction resolvase RusA-like endonuclease
VDGAEYQKRKALLPSLDYGEVGEVFREATRRGEACVQYEAFCILDDWITRYMSRIFEVEILGPPIGKARPKSARIKTKEGRVFTHTYTPTKTSEWEQAAAFLFKNQLRMVTERVQLIVGPVVLKVEAVADRPKRLYRKKDPEGRIWRETIPDGDNVLKTVGDALDKSVLGNDKQVVSWSIRGCYAAKYEGSMTVVRLYRL